MPDPSSAAESDAFPPDAPEPSPVADAATSRTASRRILALVAVALSLGLLLGAAAGYAASRPEPPTSDSREAGFARDMSTHHAQAVEMGMVAFAKASHPDVRFMGRDIALTQQGQIGIMQGWLQQWNLDPTGEQPPMAWMPEGAGAVRDGLMPGMATEQQMDELRAATGEAVDITFLRLMQQHHLGGIHMARAIVGETEQDEVQRLAQAALDSQQRELNDIGSLLNAAKRG